MKSVYDPPQSQEIKKPSVIDISKSARNKLKARRYREAKELFRTGLEMEPENPYLLSGMGDACRETEDFAEAENCYLTLLKSDEKNLFALRGLGDVYKRTSRHQEAIQQWEKYLKYRPQDKHVMTRIADSCKLLSQFERAEQAYRQILKIDPRDRFAMTGLADLQHRMGFDEKAIETYEQVLKFDPDELHILTIVGKLCWRISDFDRAEKYFRHALSVDPENPYALYGLGNCYRWYRQYEKALEIWMRILETSEGTQTLHVRMGDAYFHLGRLNEAHNCYQKALGFGYDPFAAQALVCLFSVQNNYSEAANYFGSLMVQAQQPADQLDVLVKRFLRNDQADEMKQFFQFLIKNKRGEAEVLSLLEQRLNS